MWKKDWLKELAAKEEGFGHNSWDDYDSKDAIKQFTAIEKLGGKIYMYFDDLGSPYNIRIDMPKSNTAQRNILECILTKCPPPSCAKWTTFCKKRMLDLEWHW